MVAEDHAPLSASAPTSESKCSAVIVTAAVPEPDASTVGTADMDVGHNDQNKTQPSTQEEEEEEEARGVLTVEEAGSSSLPHEPVDVTAVNEPSTSERVTPITAAAAAAGSNSASPEKPKSPGSFSLMGALSVFLGKNQSPRSAEQTGAGSLPRDSSASVPTGSKLPTLSPASHNVDVWPDAIPEDDEETISVVIPGEEDAVEVPGASAAVAFAAAEAILRSHEEEHGDIGHNGNQLEKRDVLEDSEIAENSVSARPPLTPSHSLPPLMLPLPIDGELF